jgi:hypothetical protein
VLRQLIIPGVILTSTTLLVLGYVSLFILRKLIENREFRNEIRKIPVRLLLLCLVSMILFGSLSALSQEFNTNSGIILTNLNTTELCELYNAAMEDIFNVIQYLEEYSAMLEKQVRGRTASTAFCFISAGQERILRYCC